MLGAAWKRNHMCWNYSNLSGPVIQPRSIVSSCLCKLPEKALLPVTVPSTHRCLMPKHHSVLIKAETEGVFLHPENLNLFLSLLMFIRYIKLLQ